MRFAHKLPSQWENAASNNAPPPSDAIIAAAILKISSMLIVIYNARLTRNVLAWLFALFAKTMTT
ncbi:hypothetical protein CWC25_19485 [Pseudoalteromonas sp. S4389]|nr:hypothetical protein CWC25_19485 [Pseudoalteromonas sp. S4389]